MVNQTNSTVARELDNLNETEKSAVLDYISGIVSRRKTKTKNKENSADDLILSLANAPENQRARQVFEWERVRRQNVQRAA